MMRAMLKGAVLSGFGRIPGGSRLYRRLTRELLETQATHVDKLQRVWPGYVDAWEARCGLQMNGLRVWVHEGGWTPFAPLINYLVTGQGGILTNSEASVLDRYLARAVNGALATAVPERLKQSERLSHLESLRWFDSVETALESVGGMIVITRKDAPLKLESNSVDLCHSGGALEHYAPHELQRFIGECFRILKPGGVASHVFDHRDHLHHADRGLPFLAHLALPNPVYALLCGHPLLYHNRLNPAETCAMFERAGFGRIALRRMILPDRRYVDSDNEAMAGTPGLRRALLARRFSDLSDADLRTAAAHYLYRKPD